MSGDPQPVGYPRCGQCAFRSLHRADVCLPCIRSATGHSHLGGYCTVCTHPIARDADTCSNDICNAKARFFSSVSALGYYPSFWTKIHRLKGIDTERPKWGWGIIFGTAMAGMMAALPKQQEHLIVVANPSNPSKGYDAVVQLLRGIRGAASFPGYQALDVDNLESPTVVRTRDVPSMKGAGPARRAYIAAKELRPALSVERRERVQGRRVVVVDDLFTTGHTVNEVALALRAAGASRVDVAVIARQTRR